MATALPDRTQRLRARLLDRHDRLIADAEAALGDGATPAQRRVAERLLDADEAVCRVIDTIDHVHGACSAARRKPTTVERRKLHQAEIEAEKLLG